MRLGLRQRGQDHEKNSPANNAPSILPRVTSQILPGERLPPLGKTSEYDNANQNLFPQKYRDAAEYGYSEAESRQTSAKLWSIYIDEAKRYDAALVESWKADMEGMLIFVLCLFSASLTAFLIESYRTLQPDSGDTTVQILTQISEQLMAMSNNASFMSPESPSFQPTPSSLVCNTLWFISLSLSITCALLATLVEQWAREFLHKTETRPSPIRRGRVFSFLYFGVRRFGMHAVVDLIPLLLHVALVLFLAGLVAFLLPINHVMMGLIGGILALFLTLYAILTILPIISLDCPYRTPFSPVVWSLLQYLRTPFHSSPSPSSSNASKINDVVVDEALEKSESRDQQAFVWTMESLTDDTELLPFLEAIPEAIHGPRGFHLANDYLFIPLLNGPTNQPSLGSRIADFMRSCRNLGPDDPRRNRGLVAGMKATYALSMISRRTGEMFNHGGCLWFDLRNFQAVRRPDNEIWPDALALTADIAMEYSCINNLRNHVSHLVRGGCTHAQIVDGVQKLLKNNAKYSPPRVFSTALRSFLDSLKQCSDGAGQGLEVVLNSIMEPDIWLEANVSIVSRFLMQAARLIYNGGDLSYDCLKICFNIVPDVPLPKSPLMSRPTIIRPDFTHWFDPALHKTTLGEISGLDWIMRCFLRVIPLVAPEDAVPILTTYLPRRNDPKALHFAIQECNLQIVVGHLIDMLPSHLDTDILLAIFSLIGLNKISMYRSGTDRAEKLWAYMMEHNGFSTPSPLFLSLSAWMTIGKHHHIRLSAWELIARSSTPPAPLLEELRTLATHPLLPEMDQNLGGTAEDLVANIDVRVKQAVYSDFTQFLDACVQTIKPLHMKTTMSALRPLIPEQVEAVDAKVMTRYAQAWVTLVRHLMDNPTDDELKGTTATILLWSDGPARHLYHSSAAPIFKEALQLFLEFLRQQRISEDDDKVESTKRALESLTARIENNGMEVEPDPRSLPSWARVSR